MKEIRKKEIEMKKEYRDLTTDHQCPQDRKDKKMCSRDFKKKKKSTQKDIPSV